MMPLINGPTTHKLVRERLPQHDEVPFIFLTAKATREDILAGKKMGADDYLTKPIDYDLLLATIETRLEQVKRIPGHQRSQAESASTIPLHEEHHNRDPLTVALIAQKEQHILPIENALKDLGCLVEFIPEEKLDTRTDAVGKNDLCFLVYSKKVHFYLSELMNSKKEHGRGAHGVAVY